jgi:hypothetical protein
MSDPVIIAIIVGLSTCIQAAIATFNHADTRRNTKEVERKVEETHTAINGRMDQLLIAANLQGRQEQRAETRAEEK